MPSLALRLPLVLLALPLMASCRVIVVPAEAEPTGTPDLQPDATPQPERPAAQATRAGCTDLHGRVLAEGLPISGDSRSLAYRLYLPPCFDPESEAPYPTLYLLHGLAQSEAEWDDLGIDAVADRLILEGSVPPFVIVMPGERTGFDMLSVITGSLLPHLEASLPTGGQPGLRAVGGLSRGAGWALRIGAQRPDLFGAIGLHSPAVLSPDLYLLPTWARQIPASSAPRLWLDIGTDDTLLPAARELRAILDDLRWPYTWVLNRGEHTSSYWSKHLEQYLRWYAQGWPSSSPLGASGGS
jgi:enterochelin esterase-like enzyme